MRAGGNEKLNDASTSGWMTAVTALQGSHNPEGLSCFVRPYPGPMPP